MEADTPAESEVNKDDKSVENAKMSERDIVIKLDIDQTGNNIEFTEKISLNNGSEVKETSMIIEQAKKSSEDELEEDDNDDVPGDFFDDFLKEDFMAGLDVVDEDEGEEKNEDEEVPLKTTSKRKKITIEEKPEKKKVELQNHDLRQLLTKEKEKRNMSDLRNVLKGKGSRKLKKSKAKPINADEFDIRRDPKKTKRDIERDKARCEKDKEKKIISEKLKLVETGLVPPGMEMETDLDDIKKQNDKDEESKTSEPKGSKSSRRRSNSRSPRSRRSPLRRSPRRSPIRRRSSPRRSPRRVSSNLTRSPKRSPLRRRSRERSSRRSRERSPRRSRERTPRRSRERSPRKSRERSPRKSRERSPRKSRERSPRKSRERSPRRSRDDINRLDVSLKRSMERLERELERERNRSLRRSMDRIDRDRNRSPRRSVERINRNRSPRRSMERIDRDRNRSPRRSMERLDRDRNRRSRSRNKYSPRHKRSRSRSPKRRRDTEKKKSFLQEIADKLNETRPINIPYQLMHPLPSDIYHVGPHTQSLHPNPIIPGPVPVPVPPPVVNQFQAQQQYDQSFFIGTPPALNSPNVPINLPIQTGPQMPLHLNAPPPMMQNAAPSNNDVSKLFQDKKITLTEFLSITAKPEIYSASSAHMKEKIKVISRCQEAIKYLGNSEKKLTGPFVVLKGVKTKSPADKYKSPLLKSSQIKLPFTEVPKTEEYRSEFNSYIDNLLVNLGLAKDEVIVIDDPEPPPQEMKRPQVAPPPPPKISLGKKVEPKPAPEKYKLSKFVQTDAPACFVCDRRKKITFKNVGTQCGNDGIMFSVGTQASDDDFYTRLPTSQSLASLTPAQLLARSGMSKPARNYDDSDFEMYPKKLPVRPAGYAYGADLFGANQISPPKFPSPGAPGRAFDLPGRGFEPPARPFDPPARAFDPPSPGGVRGNRPEANRYSFNNYY